MISCNDIWAPLAISCFCLKSFGTIPSTGESSFFRKTLRFQSHIFSWILSPDRMIGEVILSRLPTESHHRIGQFPYHPYIYIYINTYTYTYIIIHVQRVALICFPLYLYSTKKKGRPARLRETVETEALSAAMGAFPSSQSKASPAECRG